MNQDGIPEGVEQQGLGGSGAARPGVRVVRLGRGQDVLVVRSRLQRRLLEALPTAEWRPHFSGLARQLKKSPSSVWDAYKALQAQGLHAEVTLMIVPGLVQAGRPVRTPTAAEPSASGRLVTLRVEPVA